MGESFLDEMYAPIVDSKKTIWGSGEMINTVHYQYNALNQLLEYKDNSQTITYTYDGAGNRVVKTVNGTITRYINNINHTFSQVGLETTGEGMVKKRYSFGYKGRTAYYDAEAASGDKARYYLYDYPGRSVATLVDKHGVTRGRYQYDSFGKLETTPPNSLQANTFRYTGEQYEPETGLVFLRARYYNPEIGRFISKDPFAGWMHNPQSKNMYAYVENNPLKYEDPSGLDTYAYGTEIGVTGFGVGGTLSIKDVTDDQGNSALHLELGGGRNSNVFAISVGGVFEHTNASHVNQLLGPSNNTGFNLGILGLAGSVGKITAPTYSGEYITEGTGASAIPLGWNSYQTHTINIPRRSPYSVDTNICP